jgi:hypothetical protein
MAGTAAAPASPLSVPETERIARLLADLSTAPVRPQVAFADHASASRSSTLKFRKPAPRTTDAAADRRLEPLGRELGQRLAELFPFPGDLPAERAGAAVRAAFRHLGWVEPTLDLGRSEQNVIIVQVGHGPADWLVAGTLAGLLSQIAGIGLDAAPVHSADEARLFVVAPPEQLSGVET